MLSAPSPSEQHLSLFIDEEPGTASWQAAELEFVPRWPGSKPVLLPSALLTLASLVPAVPSREDLHVIRFVALTRGCVSLRWLWCFERASALTPVPVRPLRASRPSTWWKGASWSPSTTLWRRRRASSPSCQRYPPLPRPLPGRRSPGPALPGARARLPCPSQARAAGVRGTAPDPELALRGASPACGSVRGVR